MRIIEILKARFYQIDPKWFLMGNHTTLLIYGLYSSCLQRTPLQIALAFGVGVPLELLIERIKKGRDWRPWDQTKSALVIILGLLIFLISRHWWFYGVAAVMAMIGKSILLRPDGRHIYNPTGITILSMVAFFPNYVFVRGDQFNGTILPFFSLVFFGVMATTRANRWRSTVCYLLSSFITCLIITSVSTSYEFVRLFGPDFGAEGLLFMFLMFTDPRTSPNRPGGQVIYGVLIGILNITFRSVELAYSQFLALFMVSSFIMPFIDMGYRHPLKIQEWREKLRWSLPITTQLWIKRSFITLLLVSLPLAWFFKVESWPWSHYPMFASSRSVAEAKVLRPALETESGEIRFLDLEGEYRGYAFLLRSLHTTERWDKLNQTLRLLYRRHRKNEPTSERARALILIERTADPANLEKPLDKTLYRISVWR